MTFDRLTPEEIERTTFPQAEQGYDISRVDSFVRTMSEQVRELNRQLDIATGRHDKPYLSLGREMGDLLEHASRVAAQATEKARREAAELLENARAKSTKITEKAAGAQHDAEQEAEDIVRKARSEAGRLRERAAEVRRLVEAEAAVLRQEAQREARKLKSEAKKEAQKMRAESEAERAAAVKELERRIRKLQEMEVSLRSKISGLGQTPAPTAPCPRPRSTRLPRSAGP